MTSEQDDAQPTADARDEPQDDAPQADGAQSGTRPGTRPQTEPQDDTSREDAARPQTEPEAEAEDRPQAKAQAGARIQPRGEAGPQDGARSEPQDSAQSGDRSQSGTQDGPQAEPQDRPQAKTQDASRDEPQDDASQADDASSQGETQDGSQAETQDGSQGEAGPQDDDPQDLPPSYPPQERPTSSDDSESSRPARRRPRRGSFLVPFVVILLLVALFKTFVIQYFEIPTGSMESTLVNGDRVAVTMYDSDDIKRGDIIVFRDPDHWLNSIDPTGLRGLIRDGLILIRILPEDSGHHLIKRVIGMPGDRVVSDGRGTVSVNGVVLHETYVKAGVSPSEVAFDVTVPDSMVWVMGDNRSNSADSRAHMDDVHGGFVPLSDVVGVAKSIIWPVSRWDGLGEGEDVFAGVPAPR